MEKTDEQLNCQCYVLHDFKDSMMSLERLFYLNELKKNYINHVG